MDLQASLLRQLENPNLSLDQRAELRCQAAKELIESGDYEAARQAMAELWQRIGEHPKIEGLEPNTAGEVLLCVGILTGLVGSKNQVTDAQETAKNLISESLAIFESHKYGKKIAEAQSELAMCYWREGRYDEARDLSKQALSYLSTGGELQAKILLRWAIIERESARYHDALRILTDNVPLFGKINKNLIKGSYHATLADVLENLWELEKHVNYLDRAFVEYAAAGFYFEQAEHRCYCANVENNIGFLYFKVGRYKEAHEHLDKARRIVVSLKDSSTLAQYDETRARVFLAEGRNAEAERVSRLAVRTLENGDRLSLLSEALITHGRALARLGHYEKALSEFKRAIEVAQQSGTLSHAGEAALTAFEELGNHLTSDEMKSVPSGLALGKELRRYEHELIKDALIRAEGRVTHAAKLLGTSHQRVAYLIENKHKDLLSVRKPKHERPKRK